MTKKLQKLITKKLDKLEELLNTIDEARVIQADDPDTWDSDTLYNLIENCKQIRLLLEDSKHSQLDEYGDPIILEKGICSLVDDYSSKDEETED